MIRQLLYKWFGLSEAPCQTCDVLREQLTNSELERRELLMRLLNGSQPEPLPTTEKEELKPIGQTFVPWRVRKEMLEAEDYKKAQLMRDKEKEINDLEKELGIK
jgi:hypothetical protein